MATDYSYMCDDMDCPFWIHKSCAILPQTHSFGIHSKHPLTLSDSLPKIYRKFKQFCKICNEQVHPSRWLYYCGSCRFFAHVQCALSKNPVIRQEDCSDDPKLMHLPAPDEPSMNLIMENCIKNMISLSENTTTAPPHHINHWSHQHALSLKNRNAIFTTDEDSNQELERLIICDGCTKPISSSDDDTEVFYECSQCIYSLHTHCAQFPEVMQHQVIGMLKGFRTTVFRNDTFRCDCCDVYSNGLQMFQPEKKISLDVWCASLPKKIKHQAHHHPLENHKMSSAQFCEACLHRIYSTSSPFVFGCISCRFYLHVNCLLKPATVNHRWDPHPLRLVRSVEDDVEDHPHDFECEFCSKEIDTNTWFYHCNICDLSFHLNDCINPYNDYSNVKLGATNIKNKAHRHDLTLVLNKNKKRPPCGSCSKYTTGALIIECKPCNFVLHSDCKDQGASYRRDIRNRLRLREF